MEEKKKPLVFYGYIVAAAAFGIWFTIWGIQQTYGVFFKPVLEYFGWSRTIMSGARSVNAGMSGLLGIFAGRMTDKIGPRQVVLIFGALVGIGFILLSFVNNAWQFYLIYGVLVGTGMSVATIPTMTAVARWFRKRRGLISGIVQTGGSLGGTVTAPLAGWLILTHGWRFSYMAFGGAGLILVLILGSLLRKDPKDMGLEPYGGADAKIEGRNKGRGGGGSGGAAFSFKSSVRTSQFWMLAVMLFAYGWCRTVMSVHIAAHVTDQGLPLTVGATTLAIMSASSIAGRLAIGQLSDMIGNKKADIICYGGVTISLGCLIFVTNIWGLYAAVGLFGVTWGGQAVIRMTMIAEVYGVGSLGSVWGILEFISQIGAIIGPLLAGWIFDIKGTYELAFIISTALSATGLISIILLKPLAPASAITGQDAQHGRG
ncbi:MFS transporter [Chloroflexota bacterium]